VITSKNLIAIGASTGGTEAVLAIVRNFPADTPGVVVTQHMPAGFTRMYAERLQSICAMNVKEAENGEPVRQGTIYIAPGGLQMRVVRDAGRSYHLTVRQEERVNGHAPSVDVLFHSVASAAGPLAIGVILTGMGADGACGLLEMRNNGAYTIGQDEASCVVYGMPREAYLKHAVCEQLPLGRIAGTILQHLGKLGN
jgi:two-component system chemotaxis response regulator CheB